jgi:hypothetical protein
VLASDPKALTGPTASTACENYSIQKRSGNHDVRRERSVSRENSVTAGSPRFGRESVIPALARLDDNSHHGTSTRRNPKNDNATRETGGIAKTSGTQPADQLASGRCSRSRRASQAADDPLEIVVGLELNNDPALLLTLELDLNIRRQEITELRLQ